MKRHLAFLIALPAMALASIAPAEADSWIFRPSTYSHAPAAGARINQFARKEPAYARVDPTYSESGYRHLRTVIRGPRGTADRSHVVQTWGGGEMIRPYGEWQYPYRAGATPFGPWGNPTGPWTLPFDSWQNPYGQWNRYPYASPYYSPGYGHDGFSRGYGRGPGAGHTPPPGTPHGSPPGPSHGGGHSSHP